ncbi:Prephenate dehydratase-domain-containing protein [Phlyctochytrium arcticum]|nr:Prephenate dehydratase-domain-containing protein [Phlyctochytrium arcticum]
MSDQAAQSLAHIRQKIDTLDADLVRLLNERAQLSVNVGLAKQKAAKVDGPQNEHIHRPGRELQIYERLETLNYGPLPTTSVQAIFREIMSASISLQKKTTIAFLGPRGTYSHQVAFARFGDSIQYVEQETIADVFDSVATGVTNYGVVPFENSRFGSVQETLDAFVSVKGAMIRAEHYLPVRHALLGHAGSSKDQIRKIYSHSQGFGQCQKFLATNYRGVERINVSSTAQAAELASREPSSAAICSQMCAAMYGLVVHEESVEDAKDNTTRFLIIGDASDAPTGKDHTLLYFTVDHRQPGALCDVLNVIKSFHINLTRIDSRPSGQRPWHYNFFIELDGHHQDPNVGAALEQMKQFCLDIRVLGSYPSQKPAV